jgi:hypothetical protein
MGKQLAKLVRGQASALLVQLRIDRSRHAEFADAAGCTEPTLRADHLLTAKQAKSFRSMLIDAGVAPKRRAGVNTGVRCMVLVASSAEGDADG